MKKSRLLCVVCVCLAVVSFNASAALVSIDWKTAGDNLITRDTVSGLEWLDLTETVDLSYNDVSSQLGTGGSFEGWRYTTRAEVGSLWDAAGGQSAWYYAGFNTENNGLFDALAPLWGDTSCHQLFCEPGEGFSYYITADLWGNNGSRWTGLIWDDTSTTLSATEDYTNLSYDDIFPDTSFYDVGSALVRSSIVPIPPAL